MQEGVLQGKCPNVLYQIGLGTKLVPVSSCWKVYIVCLGRAPNSNYIGTTAYLHELVWYQTGGLGTKLVSVSSCWKVYIVCLGRAPNSNYWHHCTLA